MSMKNFGSSLKVGFVSSDLSFYTPDTCLDVPFQLLHEGVLRQQCQQRNIHISPILAKVQSGRYKITPKGDRPLTYEMANPPHFINHRKSWNSWNTCKKGV